MLINPFFPLIIMKEEIKKLISESKRQAMKRPAQIEFDCYAYCKYNGWDSRCHAPQKPDIFGRFHGKHLTIQTAGCNQYVPICKELA